MCSYYSKADSDAKRRAALNQHLASRKGYTHERYRKREAAPLQMVDDPSWEAMVLTMPARLRSQARELKADTLKAVRDEDGYFAALAELAQVERNQKVVGRGRPAGDIADRKAVLNEDINRLEAALRERGAQPPPVALTDTEAAEALQQPRVATLAAGRPGVGQDLLGQPADDALDDDIDAELAADADAEGASAGAGAGTDTESVGRGLVMLVCGLGMVLWRIGKQQNSRLAARRMQRMMQQPLATSMLSSPGVQHQHHQQKQNLSRHQRLLRHTRHLLQKNQHQNWLSQHDNLSPHHYMMCNIQFNAFTL